ncbi:hypothetical protein D3C77_430040 [compost metagenome]
MHQLQGVTLLQPQCQLLGGVDGDPCLAHLALLLQCRQRLEQGRAGILAAVQQQAIQPGAPQPLQAAGHRGGDLCGLDARCQLGDELKVVGAVHPEPRLCLAIGLGRVQGIHAQLACQGQYGVEFVIRYLARAIADAIGEPELHSPQG